MTVGLEGIKVVETASVIAAPMAGRLLADWGADVIHIEPITQKAIEARRTRAASKITNPGGDIMSDNTIRNKKMITLNLSKECGLEILHRLLKDADVFLANFRPYEVKKFKLEYETIDKAYPRLIYANLTGFGEKGPERDLPAYGNLAGDSKAGLLHSLTAPGSFPPQTTSTMTDLITASNLACGILAALFIREKTGKGQKVDVSLFHSMLFVLSGDITHSIITGRSRHTVDRKDASNGTGNTYKTKDGRWLMITLSPHQAKHWTQFCNAIGHPELQNDPKFDSMEHRAQNNIDLFYFLEHLFASKTLEEWKPCLNMCGYPWSPLQDFDEVINDPQAKANNYFVPFDDPTYGRVDLVSNPIRLSKMPVPPIPVAPETGQHTDEVLKKHGYTAEDIAQLVEQGIIA
jgi:crotonobetainyl-CoA:carnitine CoA-transferase CaiB-like acyl-CoA transferase